jgi:hypothetical protein
VLRAPGRFLASYPILIPLESADAHSSNNHPDRRSLRGPRRVCRMRRRAFSYRPATKFGTSVYGLPGYGQAAVDSQSCILYCMQSKQTKALANTASPSSRYRFGQLVEPRASPGLPIIPGRR